MSDEPDGVALNAGLHPEQDTNAFDAPHAELPRWESHVRVSGDKITGVFEGSELVLFRWHLACGAWVDVHEWLANRVAPRSPAVGGYYVQYADGFESWMPKEEFEAIYTRVATEA